MVLFIDTDPGTDDIAALIYLFQHSTDQVVGLSSVFGNVDLETTTRNLQLIAGHFIKALSRHIDVFKGLSKPIIGLPGNDAAFVHGTDGCGQFFSSEYYLINKEDIDKLIESVQLSDLMAVMGLIEMSKKYNGELVVVALGPLTNIALAQIIDPDFGSRIKEIFIMGGDLHGYGNSDGPSYAEFNFSKDPESVYVVLKEIKCKKTILPREPNLPITIKPELCEKWQRKLEKKQDLLTNLKLSVIKFRGRFNTTFRLYDLLLAILMVDPSVVTEMLALQVTVELDRKNSRGKVIYDNYNKCGMHNIGEFNTINVVTKLDSVAIFQKLETFFQ